MANEPVFKYVKAMDTSPMPDGIPDVPEVGATSAPLKSASYFIGARCLPYNDDFMLCRKESKNGPVDCLKEGRRVTRCAISVLEDLNKHCLEEFRLHWQCLENGNQQLYQCRPAERLLNKCVFEKLNLEKRIPGVPENEQIHLRKSYHLKPAYEDGASLKAQKKALQQQN